MVATSATTTALMLQRGQILGDQVSGKYNTVPDALATLAYDATRLMTEAIIKAGSNDPSKIRDAMATIEGFKAVSGSISFDKDGNPVKSAVVIQVVDGKQKYVKPLIRSA